MPALSCLAKLSREEEGDFSLAGALLLQVSLRPLLNQILAEGQI